MEFSQPPLRNVLLSLLADGETEVQGISQPKQAILPAVCLVLFSSSHLCYAVSFTCVQMIPGPFITKLISYKVMLPPRMLQQSFVAKNHNINAENEFLLFMQLD